MARSRRRPDGEIEKPSNTPPQRRKWIWFRSEPGARSKAEEEFLDLPIPAKAGLSVRISRYKNGESRLGDVDSLGDGIYEIRYRHLNNQYRVLFMLWGPHCVGLTAFFKNQRKTSKTDIDRAAKRSEKWIDKHGKEPANPN